MSGSLLKFVPTPWWADLNKCTLRFYYLFCAPCSFCPHIYLVRRRNGDEHQRDIAMPTLPDLFWLGLPHLSCGKPGRPRWGVGWWCSSDSFLLPVKVASVSRRAVQSDLKFSFSYPNDIVSCMHDLHHVVTHMDLHTTYNQSNTSMRPLRQHRGQQAYVDLSE